MTELVHSLRRIDGIWSVAGMTRFSCSCSTYYISVYSCAGVVVVVVRKPAGTPSSTHNNLPSYSLSFSPKTPSPSLPHPQLV